MIAEYQEGLEAMPYTEFLASKRLVVPNVGREVAEIEIHPSLFPFQKALVRWAIRKGRAALFTATGTGKTRCQIEFARLTGERTLILAPLAVSRQTVREAAEIGVTVTYARRQSEAASGISITNYELLHHFQPEAFGTVVLDESSILKSFDGVTRQRLIDAFQRTPFRLAATATPAPNHISEIANHAAFLGVMTRQELMASFFVNSDTEGWRLKKHATEPFYRWLASWAMSLNMPSDIGFSDDGYELPPLSILSQFVETDATPEGRLFFDRLQGVTERATVRKATVSERIEAVCEQMRAEPEEPWLCWYGLLDEGRALKRAFGDEAVFVEGSLPPEEKESRLMAFVNGEARILITHRKIAGFGLNLQHCARMAFVGMDDSWEGYYQCIRRCWRFGQTRPVNVHIVLTEPQRGIFENVQAKEREAMALSAELVANASEYEREELGRGVVRQPYQASRAMRLPEWMR